MKQALEDKDKALSAQRKYRGQSEQAEEKLSKITRQANRERHMVDILKQVVMSKMDLSEDYYEY